MITTNIYRVIGIITHISPNSNHCESIPLGIYDLNNKYQNLSKKAVEEIFLPSGKIFIPDIASEFNMDDIVEFYTRPPVEFKLYEHKNIYSIDPWKSKKIINPKVIMIDALLINSDSCEYDLIDSSINIENIELYVYDKNKNILYEKITYNKAIGIRAVKGKSIKGIKWDLFDDENFIIKKSQFIYLTDDFMPNFSNCENQFIIDLSTKQQKIDCFKKTLFELNKFTNKSIQSFGYLLNIVKDLDFSNLPKVIKQRNDYSRDYLEQVKITDEEIKNLLSSDSNLGSFFIEKVKQEKQAEIEKEIKMQISEQQVELNLLCAQIVDKKEELNLLSGQETNLIETKNIIEKEIKTLRDNKETIYETIKAIMKCHSNTSNQADILIKPKIYTEIVDLPVNEKLDSEFDYSLVNLKTKFILYNKYSLIPSVSYVYTIANSIGNSKVLNLSVEYDWLHYSDFVNHGLLDFIKDAHLNNNKFYFLHFENINIIPMDCGFSPIFKVFNKEMPYFEGSTMNLPNNLFVTATILPTKNEHEIGHPLPFYLKSIFKGIGDPSDNLPLNFERLKRKREYKYEFSEKLIQDLRNQLKSDYGNNDSINTISSYYEF